MCLGMQKASIVALKNPPYSPRYCFLLLAVIAVDWFASYVAAPSLSRAVHDAQPTLARSAVGCLRRSNVQLDTALYVIWLPRSNF
jgi:hypothetical protein